MFIFEVLLHVVNSKKLKKASLCHSLWASFQLNELNIIKSRGRGLDNRQIQQLSVEFRPRLASDVMDWQRASRRADGDGDDGPGGDGGSGSQ